MNNCFSIFSSYSQRFNKCFGVIVVDGVDPAVNIDVEVDELSEAVFEAEEVVHLSPGLSPASSESKWITRLGEVDWRVIGVDLVGGCVSKHGGKENGFHYFI